MEKDRVRDGKITSADLSSSFVTGRGRGDLFVTMKVITPKKLTREQKKLLEQLAGALPKEKFEPTPVTQEDRGLFGRVKDIFG